MRLIYSILITALATSGLTYYALTPASKTSSLKEEVNRWRSRAYEAEQKNDVMRKRLAQHVTPICETNDQQQKIYGIEQEAYNESKVDINKGILGNGNVDREVAGNGSVQEDNYEEWDMLITGALETGIERLGINLDPQKRHRLISALTKMRDSSLSLEDTKNDANDPGYLRNRLQQTVTLLEVDRLFREELGVSASQFIDTVGSNEVEEINLEEQK